MIFCCYLIGSFKISLPFDFVVICLLLFCVQNTTKIDPQVMLPVFLNIILCLDALSGRESASMATLFDMTYLLVYSILRGLRDVSLQGISLIDEKCFTTKFHHLSSNFDQKGLCCLFPLPISNLSKTKSVSHLIFS